MYSKAFILGCYSELKRQSIYVILATFSEWSSKIYIKPIYVTSDFQNIHLQQL